MVLTQIAPARGLPSTEEVMTVTYKKLNQYLQAQLPHCQIVKGSGGNYGSTYVYHYFTWADDAPQDAPDPPEDVIHASALNEFSMEWWEEQIDYAVKEHKNG